MGFNFAQGRFHTTWPSAVRRRTGLKSGQLVLVQENCSVSESVLCCIGQFLDINFTGGINFSAVLGVSKGFNQGVEKIT